MCRWCCIRKEKMSKTSCLQNSLSKSHRSREKENKPSACRMNIEPKMQVGCNTNGHEQEKLVVGI